MTVTILRAMPGQTSRLTQIAHSAKSYWGYPARWIELWHNQLTVTSSYVREHEVYAAVDRDETLLGFYALAGAGDKLILDHLWVQPSSFGAGIGRLLFEHAMARARELGAKTVEIESDPHAEGFYQHLGAVTIGEVSYELEGQPRLLPLMAYSLETGL
ncbi:MAG: GNAT family N-acetyltransferase [Caldilinea sp.]|uniref:GNAT family N-acetyltransferase n=1 Tax=Caldilinea sp. TaxID=2293560 RepID=UPI002C62CA0B|nr:GNAT family N-acetyltransferase [Anaerolineales bacterium]HQY90297.1 GNAT family N-acetyltransferase [Caldilinea sp.]HRA67788.1 GNAT family N-acetyltransferase [Caldilinea sp.]